MLHRFFDKNSAGTCTHKGTEINFESQEQEEELHKPIIRKFKKT